jgi:hypothetical protein
MLNKEEICDLLNDYHIKEGPKAYVLLTQKREENVCMGG